MVSLEKIASNAPIADIMELRKFLDKISHYDENGFNWPKRLMDARGIEEVRQELAVFERKEHFIPEEYAHGYVPQEVFWICNEEEEIVGMIKIRALLTPALLREGGHIGYGIVPEYRGRGFATDALKQAVKYCRNRYSMHDVLLTAHPNNTASRRVIEAAGGKEWDTIDGHVRYWIHC